MTFKRAAMLVTMAVGVALATSSAWAVDGPVVGHFSFGPSFVQGDPSEALDDGWAIHGGATWFSTGRPNLGYRLDFGYDWWDAKNSFLDQIHQQYVQTARAKGLSERRVLYGHVFRNAMLIVIAGFPGVLIGLLFTSTFIIEAIFTLDGLGLLGYEAALGRDYPIMFGTLYIYTLIGLVLGLISDLTYAAIDPRIDFARRDH